MKFSNLQRAAEIAAMLPDLEEARKALSDDTASLVVIHKGKSLPLPTAPMRHNLLNLLNVEINRMRKEVDEL